MSSLREARQEYDRQAAAYDRRWAQYLRYSTEPILKLLDLHSGETLLDVGCGTGALLDQISRQGGAALIYGIDASEGMLQRARARLGSHVHLIQADVTALPFASKSFSTVVSTSSLRYWADPGGGIREIARVLQPGGRLLLLDWCGDAARHRLLVWWLTRTGRVGGRIYRSNELSELLARGGFRAEVECLEAGWYWRFVLARATLI
jgi:ubiquinone/menaquinone biosynthesis C-methylase UbiE